MQPYESKLLAQPRKEYPDHTTMIVHPEGHLYRTLIRDFHG